jgi:hypothetical protein
VSSCPVTVSPLLLKLFILEFRPLEGVRVSEGATLRQKPSPVAQAAQAKLLRSGNELKNPRAHLKSRMTSALVAHGTVACPLAGCRIRRKADGSGMSFSVYAKTFETLNRVRKRAGLMSSV